MKEHLTFFSIIFLFVNIGVHASDNDINASVNCPNNKVTGIYKFKGLSDVKYKECYDTSILEEDFYLTNLDTVCPETHSPGELDMGAFFLHKICINNEYLRTQDTYRVSVKYNCNKSLGFVSDGVIKYSFGMQGSTTYHNCFK